MFTHAIRGARFDTKIAHQTINPSIHPSIHPSIEVSKLIAASAKCYEALLFLLFELLLLLVLLLLLLLLIHTDACIASFTIMRDCIHA